MWKKIWHFLTDRTSAKEDMRDVAAILRDILESSKGDGIFDDVLQRVMEQHDPANSHYRIPRFRLFLIRSRRFEDRNASLFTVARHVLEDLPKIYGLPAEELIDKDR